MVQITRSGKLVSASDNELAPLKLQFAERHHFRLPRLLSPDLMELVQRQIEETAFAEITHQGIGANKELCLHEGALPGILNVLINSQALFRVIRGITGCPRIGCFSGRVYRASPGAGHHDAWHDDLVEHRMIAMSINLGTEEYSGGVLQLRDAGSKRVLHEVANTGSGDAIVFRLAGYLQHRITDVEGAHPKTAFAGWFRSQPDFVSLLTQSARQS
jgi:hypothetical protein